MKLILKYIKIKVKYIFDPSFFVIFIFSPLIFKSELFSPLFLEIDHI